ncbi:MAG: Rpn family recombination-promoting nuclease/putative transposase [Planctomycetes bacterium]|nr:Rpn family recombination-promoting nuclease/putative transposase [Planctomycetota bacterium]MCB9887535.1 Rpn family recombination-promoting nuclease/putative transposase [Planctomycetota bacterium]
MPTPFDDLFHYVFQHVWHAQQLLRCLLPPVLVGAIDWVTLRGATEKVHDETLRQRVTDVLFAVDLVRGGSLCLLLEHKSHLDPDLHRQLLRYSVRLHDLPPGPGDDLPVGVLPIVVHHGEPGAAPAARPTTAAERAIAALQPDVPFVLDDLRSSDEDRLRERGLTALATLTLLCLAHLRSAGPAETLASLHRWSDLLRAADGDPHPPGGAQAVRAICWYVLRVTEVDARDLQATFEAILHRPEDQVMGTLDRMLREQHDQGLIEGEAKGEAKGQAKGLAEGQAKGLVEGETRGLRLALRKVLQRRFGDLSPAATERLDRGDRQQLQQWTERVLDVASADELFTG